MFALLFIIAGGVFLGGCATIGASKPETPKPSSDQNDSSSPSASESREPLTEFERATNDLESWGQDCKKNSSACYLPDEDRVVKMKRWFGELTHANPSQNPAAFQSALQKAKLFESGSSAGIDNPLKLIGATARIAEAIDGQAMDQHKLSAQELEGLLMGLPLNLESHRGEPLLLVAEYLKSRSPFIDDAEKSAIYHVAISMLPVLNYAFQRPDADKFGNESMQRSRIADFQSSLLTDQQIDSFERQTTLRWINRWGGNQTLEGPMGYLLPMLYPSKIKGDVLKDTLIRWGDPEKGVLTMMVNHGTSELPAEGYLPVPDITKTPLNKHLITANCFAAAFCQDDEAKSCVAEQYPWREIDANYRLVDLGKEKAAPGDVLVYGIPYYEQISKSAYAQSMTVSAISLPLGDGQSASFVPLHASLVSDVDSRGIPKRAIGKMGADGPVRRHDPAHTTLQYGPLILVFRKK